LVGEKYVSHLAYEKAVDRGYDQAMFSGVDLDTTRWTLQTPIQDEALLSDRSFGSAHSGGCQMALCDGSVRTISYQIDGLVHRYLGHRKDGRAVETP
jgi:prepilin-type processing-associated H-X9-DG protein